MDQKTIFLTILGMLAVTYLPRVVPALFFASRPMPEALRRFLSVVPPAVLGALLAQSVLLEGGRPRLDADNVFLWAALLTGFLAWRFKGFFGPVLAGMALVAGGRLLL
ncbi:MAG: AzlD domain-containing protein [Thermodesulfobacteriota bacterium]